MERLLDAGVGVLPVLVEIIAPAQRRVGERWQRGEWSVAREHAATGVSMAAAEAVGRHARRAPVSRGKVVLACAEREWHALPALVVAHGLRADGWEVTFLGAATPPGRLGAYLQETGPDAAAVSCSVLRALPSTRNFIEAGTECGIPVVAGGSAFGQDDLRARALGATAWAGGAREAIAVVASLPSVVAPAPALPAGPLAEQRALDLHHTRLVAEILGRAPAAVGDAAEPAVVLHDAVEQMLFAVQAALLTGDTRILSETFRWVSVLLDTRAGAGSQIGELAGSLARSVREFPLAARLVREHWAVPPHGAAETG